MLRYFESREAVLLELLDSAFRDWLSQLDQDLAVIDPNAPTAERGDQLAAVVASSLASRPVLCDLISAQAAALEHNLSPKVAAGYKRAAIANVASLGRLVAEHLGELGEHDAFRFAAATVMVTGAVWTHAQPSAAMLAAYEANPDLVSMRVDFLATLRQVLEVLIAGLLAREPAARAASASGW